MATAYQPRTTVLPDATRCVVDVHGGSVRLHVIEKDGTYTTEEMTAAEAFTYAENVSANAARTFIWPEDIFPVDDWCDLVREAARHLRSEEERA